jgi:hypothetical protein
MAFFKYPIARLLCLTCLFAIPQLPAADLSKLKVGSKVRLLSASAGVCEGKVSAINPDGITVRLTKGTPKCGSKDAALAIPAAQITAIDRQQHSPVHHVAKGGFLGAGCLLLGFATGAAISYGAGSSAGGVAGGAGVCGAIFAVGYLPRGPRTVALSCADPQHCGN